MSTSISLSLEKCIDSFLLIELVRQLISSAKILSFNGPVTWGCMYLSIISIIIYCVKKRKSYYSWPYLFIFLWFIWLIICIFRGIFAIEIISDLKNFLGNIPCLVLPIFGLLFYNPSRAVVFLKKWNYLLLVIFISILARIIIVDHVHFHIGPSYFLYFPLILLIPSNRWKLFVALLLIVMFLDLSSRAQIIKAIVCLSLFCGILIKGKITIVLVRFVSIILYFLPIVLLYLGISGKFNIFDYTDHSQDNLVRFESGQYISKEKSEMSIDTRTFLYTDVIISAIENNYIITGRTPARGNDADLFFAHMGTNGMTADMRLERNKNEFCHPNIFTWMGLIGVILYAFIYLHATFLAVFFSKNSYIPFFGALTSFNWFFGWIENTNTYDMMNIGVWIIIAICLSPQFRKMNEMEFKIWFKSIFSKQTISPYSKFLLIKQLLLIKVLSKSTNSQKGNNPEQSHKKT